MSGSVSPNISISAPVVSFLRKNALLSTGTMEGSLSGPDIWLGVGGRVTYEAWLE